jgi:hypothetical protein
MMALRRRVGRRPLFSRRDSIALISASGNSGKKMFEIGQIP